MYVEKVLLHVMNLLILSCGCGFNKTSEKCERNYGNQGFLEKKHVCIFVLHLIYHVVDFKKKKEK